MVKRMGAALLATVLALAIGGCANVADSSAKDWGSVEVDASQVTNGKPVVNGWVPDAVKYCKEHDGDEGVLVEITGMMTQGSAAETAQMVTLIDPMEIEPTGEGDEEHYEVKAGNYCADVYFAEPVKMTKWPHLMGVRGMAHLDSTQENKIVIVGAIESSD